tara:strand:+ start:3146 stop:3541 length:396 start_codon:yes stop_codon:yes gene_type:complete
MNTWNYQFLENEKLHYLTEHHPEDGVLGEHFYEVNEFHELEKFVSDNRIPVSLEGAEISEVKNQTEVFAAEYKLSQIDFECKIRMYEGDDKIFKSQYTLSLDMIEQLPADLLGHILKDLLIQLKEHVKEHE